MSNFAALPENVKSKFIGALSMANKAKNANEAAAWAGKVQEMMLKYAISLEEVTKAEAVKNNTPIDPFYGMVKKVIFFSGSNRDINMGGLGAALAEFMFCKCIWDKYRDENFDFTVNGLVFVGKENDVDMVMALFEKLRLTLNTIADAKFAEYKKSKFYDKAHGKEWKSQFILGAVAGIYTQMKRNYDAFLNSRFLKLDTGEVVTETEYAEKQNTERLAITGGTGGSMALMVQGKELMTTRKANVDDFYNNQYPKVKPSAPKPVTRADAYLSGVKVGKELKIREEIA